VTFEEAKGHKDDEIGETAIDDALDEPSRLTLQHQRSRSSIMLLQDNDNEDSFTIDAPPAK
jgi:hypothetical protein